jgi:hypothetical protein
MPLPCGDIGPAVKEEQGVRNSRVSRSVVMCIALSSFVVLGTVDGHAQKPSSRHGGPRDWSSTRLIASTLRSDGPDGQGSVREWRIQAKHMRLRRARGLQTHASSFEPANEQLRLDRRRPRVTSGVGSPAPNVAAAASHLDWNIRTGGFGAVVGSPAKYSFDVTSFNCSDVIYFTVDQPGSSTSPNVIAVTNPYAGCPGNAAGATPTIKWGIRMPNGTATSAVPSLDGTVLYVLENRPAGVRLHAINVDNITANPGTYNFGTKHWSSTHVLATSPIGTASSEQLFQLTWPGVTDNVSSPFLDYENEQIFFGDATGRMQHVTNANLASASKDTANFSNGCGAAQLQSPVFYNGQVSVTSYDGTLYRLDTTGPAPYTCIAAAQAGAGTAAGIAGSLSTPVIDVDNAKIIVSTNNAAGYGVAAVGVYDLAFSAGDAPASAALLGPATATAPATGAFDDSFWSNGSGNYYAVAANGQSNSTYVVRFPYSGALGAAAGFAELHRNGAGGVVNVSPLTEFLTASTQANKDFIYVAGGEGNYRFMNRIGAGFGGAAANPVGMDGWFAAPGGAVSGIVIDTNTADVTGSMATANIYYGTQGVSGSTQSTIVQLAQEF